MFRVENLSVSYGNKKILKNVSIEVKENEFVGLLGPNGSGKSTLIKTIARTVKKDEGKIYINNKNLEKLSFKETAKLFSVLWQEKQNAFDFKVFDMVMLGRTPYKKLMERENQEDIKLAKEAIEKVKLNGYEEKLLSHLSGGEAQRVFLARAFAQNTKGLILDEPTNHLDVSHQLNLLKTIKKEQKTILVALHDLNLALLFCDRIYVLYQGKIFAEGKPEDVITTELLKEVYNVDGELFINPHTGHKSIIYNIS